MAQSQNLKNTRQVEKKLANLRKIIEKVLAGYRKVYRIKAQVLC
jgi:hypothetical protein